MAVNPEQAEAGGSATWADLKGPIAAFLDEETLEVQPVDPEESAEILARHTPPRPPNH